MNSTIQTLRCTAFQDFAATAAATHEILALAPGGATITMSTISGQMTNYFDMYRFWRLKRVDVKIVSAADPSVQGVLCYVPLATTAPTTIDRIETKKAIQLQLNPNGNQDMNKMTNLVVSKPSTWLVTQSDASDVLFDSYGDLLIVLQASAAVDLVIRYDFVLEFKTLVDPNNLSIVSKKDYEDFQVFQKQKQNIVEELTKKTK